MPARNLTYRPTAVCSLFTDHSSLAEKYTFSAKERDEESGFSYFGSRYYSSDLSIWLSVDPMSDKYPSLSPYVYCADNPVKLVDPNGEWPENRAKRFMKRHNGTHMFYEKDGSLSVQYSDSKHRIPKGIDISLKKFKMNFFEKAFSKIQRPSEQINKRQTHRGGIWGTTSDPTAHPMGQDENTDAQIFQTDLDPLQQLSVPKSHSTSNETFISCVKGNSEITEDTEYSKGTSGEFIIFYHEKQNDGAVARKERYDGSSDSLKKRIQIESNGERIARINIDKQ